MRDKRFRREITHSATTQQNLHDNFAVIRDFFANDESLKLSFKDAIETILEAVVVCVDRDMEAFQLFDSQNTRGRRLDPHDLLKAFHLREMRGRKYEMEHAVTCWENVESREIRELFAWYLFPIQNWMKQEKSGDFMEKEIGEFKGVPENSPYSYGRRTVKAMPCYQIGEQFIAGDDFFGLVDYYLRVRQNIEREIFRNPSLAAVASVLNCPDASRVSNMPSVCSLGLSCVTSTGLTILTAGRYRNCASGRLCFGLTWNIWVMILSISMP